ncbi:MAG: hypothetical protein ACRYG7_47945 [Janthinobacterium lividum]
MKHTILNRSSLGGGKRQALVELQPETAAEARAITQVERATATEQEQALINDYILFNLGLGDVFDSQQHGNRFTVNYII